MTRGWERGTKLERELDGAREGDCEGKREGCGGDRGILSCTNKWEGIGGKG